MDIKKLENDVDLIYDECCEHAFGQWVNGLFTWHPNLPFLEQKEAFFILIRKLLNEGRVKFVKPDADVYCRGETNSTPKLTINDIEAHWNASTDDIIFYLRGKWPKSAAHQDDLDLNAYFYEVPALIWKGEDCKVV